MTELEKLKKELSDMQASHTAAWNQYGSELCAGDMLKQEKVLEDKIKELENEVKH